MSWAIEEKYNKETDKYFGTEEHKDPYGLDQHAHGAKVDAGKIDITLLQQFGRALHEVCRVGDYGQNKYTRGGFLGVSDGPRRYTRAMLDHWFKEFTEKYDSDPYYDTDKGRAWKGKIRHDAQVAWNALARLELMLIEEEKDGSKKR
jgi:hypothetical protein